MNLNLCCGADYRDGYINVDFSNLESNGDPIKVDVVANLLDGLDQIKDSAGEQVFPDNCAEEIIFHEALEHFNRWNGVKILKEIYRMLAPNGTLSLTVPNSERQLRLFLARMAEKLTFEDFLKGHEKWNYWKWHDDLMGGTRESDGMDGDSHKTLYSENALRSVLEHAGFKIESMTADSSIRVKATK